MEGWKQQFSWGEHANVDSKDYTKWNGWWFPRWDQHFIQHMKSKGMQTYQGVARQRSIDLVNANNLRDNLGGITCIDVGANVGLWARDFAKNFLYLHAFEPLAENRICFARNMPSRGVETAIWSLYPFALGSCPGTAQFYIDPNCCGNAGLSAEGVRNGPSKLKPTELKEITVEIKTLDSFKFVGVDLIKIDAEGSEHDVILGALETIKKYKPVLCLELPTRNAFDQQKFNQVESSILPLGYKLVDTIGKDTIWQVPTQN